MASLLDRLMRREPPKARKATTGGPWLSALESGVPLSLYAKTPQEKAARFLQAYKVGWFYKAGRKISGDVAGLDATLAYEDSEGDNEAAIVEPASSVPWVRLGPLEQFLRLMEQPNPFQTGRALFQKTQVRIDFAGTAFWYLDGGEGGQLPTSIYGISPARMWPSVTRDGQLLGWVMDRDRDGGGVPFEPEEILCFSTTSADDDYWYGTGIVEAVWAQVPLTELMARHISDVLTTGGRLAGMLWPKERSLDEDEFTDAQRAWRNVASDPNAARRLLIFPEPMEYATGAASPKDIGIPELATLTRDEILTAFPLSPYQLGVPMPGGLNSAETRREDRRDYWEGTVHPRVELLEEVIQTGLVPRYEDAVGAALDFDIAEPNLDDAPMLIEKVGALKGLISVGFDPREAVDAVGLDHIQWKGLPAVLDPNAPPPTQPTANPAESGMTVNMGDASRSDRSTTTQTVVKSKLTRDDILGREFPGLHGAIRAFLVEQRDRLVARIEETLPPTKAERRKAAPDDWWDGEQEDELLRSRLRKVYLALGRDALTVVADNMDRILPGKRVDRILDDVLSRAGLRITDINETTRRTIADTLAEGVRRGYSIPQLTGGVPEEAYGGVRGALMANGINVWDDYRAELIARTETMTAYNEAALYGYKDFNVAMVQAIDGDKDEQCATRNGQPFSVDEALAIQDHPNGTLDWVPLTDKAWDTDRAHYDLTVKALEAMAAKSVNVNVEAVRPPMTYTVVRGDDGKIAGIREEPA